MVFKDYPEIRIDFEDISLLQEGMK